MGLLDNILGSLTGAGQTGSVQGRGTSPLTKALLMLLAAKAYQHYTSQPSQTASDGTVGGFRPGSTGAGPGMGSPTGGGLGDLLGGGAGGGMLGGGLGGLLGGLVGGGGLSAIIDQFRNSGQGDLVDSWIGRGQNQPIAPNQLSSALGDETVDELAQESGMPRDDVLRELSEQLPAAVDEFTPEGRLPTEQDVSSRWV